jgi:DNA-binding response OmpR family regulator
MKLSANILVVDDDVAMLDLIAYSLRRAGHKATTASNWEAVVTNINQANANNKPFDLFILDLMMPGRSGYDVLRSLKVILHPMPPVIILSALSGIDDAVKALELGAIKYLTKPTTPDRLLMTVREALKIGSKG